jgi:predicted secreted protein
MATYLGRKITLKWKNTVLAGVREKSLSINGDAVDVTSSDDDGWQKLLSEPGGKSVEISVAGVATDDVLRAVMFAIDRTGDVLITYPNGATLAGSFFLASYKETGPYKEATTFDASLKSNGVVTYTPGT